MYCLEPKSKKWLQKQETFTLHRQINRKFKRTQVVVPEIGYQWDADTAVMTSFLKDNDSYGYFLFVIDVFSKYAWAVPLKSTKGVEMVHALSSVFSSTTPPQKLRTDKGSEFYNKPVRDFLKEKHVTHFFSRNEKKANVAVDNIKNPVKETMKWGYMYMRVSPLTFICRPCCERRILSCVCYTCKHLVCCMRCFRWLRESSLRITSS